MASQRSRTNLRNPGFRRRHPQECATGSMKIAASSLPVLPHERLGELLVIEGSDRCVRRVLRQGRAEERRWPSSHLTPPNCSGDGRTEIASSSCQP